MVYPITTLIRHLNNLILIFELIGNALAFAINYFFEGRLIKNLGFREHLSLFIVRGYLETDFNFRISTVRSAFCLTKQRPSSKVQVQDLDISDSFREKSEALVNNYFDKYLDGERWNSDDQHWSSAGKLNCRWLIPKGKKLDENSKVFVYIHGGAFMFGDFKCHQGDMSKVALLADCLVLGVNYRLGPEYVAPCQVEDITAAIYYLTSDPIEGGLGIPFSNIAIGGESAGGNIAAATAHFMRDIGLPKLAGVALQSPYLDMTHCLPSHVENRDKDVLSALPVHSPSEKFTPNYHDFPFRYSLKIGNDNLKARLLKNGHAYCASEYINHPFASPVYDTNFADLPPVLLQAGSVERFRDDSVIYSDLLNSAPQSKDTHLPNATLYMYEDLPHCFTMAFPLPQTEWISARIAMFLKQAFYPHAIKEHDQIITTTFPHLDIELKDPILSPGCKVDKVTHHFQGNLSLFKTPNLELKFKRQLKC